MKGVALYPGAFKPPTRGHFLVAKSLLDNSFNAVDVDRESGSTVAVKDKPQVSGLKIFIGTQVRNGITQEVSKKIWDIYSKYLKGNIEVVASDRNPVADVYSSLKHNPETPFFPVVGYRDASDLADLKRFDDAKNRYPNMTILTITSSGDDATRATDLRKAILDGNDAKAAKYLPQELSSQDIQEVIKLLKTSVTIEEKMEYAIEKMMIGMITEGVDFAELENTLDTMFDDLDIDINFTKHFKDRVLERGLTEEDIIELMEKIHDKYGDEVADMPKDSNRVFTHLTRLVDISSAMGSYGYDGLRDLYLTTAYKRKSKTEPEFRTNATSPKLKVAENVPGAPINAQGATPSQTRQRLQDYTNFLRNVLSSDFQVEFKGEYISVSLPIFNPEQPEDYTPNQKQLPEEVGTSNFSSYLESILEYCVNEGMTIEPRPEVELVDDADNAADVFGKTASYQPDKQKIILYTTNRHPKDILRSFCHELIHHEQNLQGRLPHFGTTNTQEDDELNKIEQEAHFRGSKLLRDWEDTQKLNTQNEIKVMAEGVYDSLVTRLAKQVITKWVTDFKKDPKRLFSALDVNIEEEDAKGRPMEFDLIAKLDFKKTKDRTYNVDGGANEGDDETEGFVALSFSVDPRELPGMWETIAMDIRDVLRHELEHLTQGGWNVRQDKQMEDDSMVRDLINKYKTLAPANYFLLDKEVDAMLQGMYYKAKKAKKPFKDIIDYYLSLQPIDAKEKETILSKWRKRLPALGIKKEYWF